jgi:hypothetical protein
MRESMYRRVVRKKSEALIAACFFLGLLFDPEDREDISLRNVGIFLKYLALQPR